jgi:RNA polymerase-binding transcription factor DksA
MKWLDLLKFTDFIVNMLSSLINRIDSAAKRKKRENEIDKNDEFDDEIDEMIDENLVDEINKELGWDEDDKK